MADNSLTARNAGGRAEFWRGLMWMAGSMASFIGMSIGSREMAATMSIQQVMFFRALVGLLIILVVARKLFPEVRQMKMLKLHFLRNVVHFTAQYLWTVGIVFLPLASVFALEFTMPIWAAFFAWIFLKEKLTTPRIIATIGGFIGVLVIVRPGLAMIHPAAGLVLIAAAGFAIALIVVKELTRHCSPGVIVVWMILIQLPLGFVAALTDWQPVQMVSVPWMFVSGIGGLTAHYCLAQALKRLEASIVMPVDFLRVPLAAIVGYYAYAEAIDLFVFLGAAIIVLSNYQVVMTERRRVR